MAGRLTLSPMAHLDLIGTICIILVGFGWAKPMSINPSYFKDPRRDISLLASAGPVAGLIAGFIFTAYIYASWEIRPHGVPRSCHGYAIYYFI